MSSTWHRQSLLLHRPLARTSARPWRQYASAFWDDIRIGRVLPFRAARDSDDDKHVHPLQLDVIERCCVLWSNPGETVLTPFMGVGSEVCGALMNGRRELIIRHGADTYRLRVTASNKLILTK